MVSSLASGPGTDCTGLSRSPPCQLLLYLPVHCGRPVEHLTPHHAAASLDRLPHKSWLTMAQWSVRISDLPSLAASSTSGHSRSTSGHALNPTCRSSSRVPGMPARQCAHHILRPQRLMAFIVALASGLSSQKSLFRRCRHLFVVPVDP